MNVGFIDEARNSINILPVMDRMKTNFVFDLLRPASVYFCRGFVTGISLLLRNNLWDR